MNEPNLAWVDSAEKAARLEAENERLRHELDTERADLGVTRSARDQARSERERLRAENERLRAALIKVDWRNEFRDLTQVRDEQIERLRNALDWYASDEQYPIELNRNDDISAFQRRAREALK